MKVFDVCDSIGLDEIENRLSGSRAFSYSVDSKFRLPRTCRIEVPLPLRSVPKLDSRSVQITNLLATKEFDPMLSYVGVAGKAFASIVGKVQGRGLHFFKVCFEEKGVKQKNDRSNHVLAQLRYGKTYFGYRIGKPTMSSYDLARSQYDRLIRLLNLPLEITDDVPDNCFWKDKPHAFDLRHRDGLDFLRLLGVAAWLCEVPVDSSQSLLDKVESSLAEFCGGKVFTVKLHSEVSPLFPEYLGNGGSDEQVTDDSLEVLKGLAKVDVEVPDVKLSLGYSLRRLGGLELLRMLSDAIGPVTTDLGDLRFEKGETVSLKCTTSSEGHSLEITGTDGFDLGPLATILRSELCKK